jgi:hypothetical protein
VTNRFLVTWRHRATQRTHPVGQLIAELEEYTFSYLPHVERIAGFRPFVNFPDSTREYRSSRLFPFFSQRVMSPRRPDYQFYVAALGLSVDASPLEVLGRAGGQRKGDTVQVVLEPNIAADGTVDHTFLLSGARHAPGDAPGLIDQLNQGDVLIIRPDSANAVNPDARYICTTHGEPIGWVPDALLDTVKEVMTSDYRLTATRANGREWPSHVRVVVRLRGVVPPTFQPFTSLSSLARA